MRDLLSAEWMKAWTGRTWLIIAASGAFMCLLASLGYTSGIDKKITEQHMDLSTVTDDSVRAWMMTLLFASLFGAVFVTREYTAGTIGRSVLLSGSRARLFTAKALVGTAMGALSGLLAVALAFATTWGALAASGHSPEITRETWLIAAGILACNVFAGPWGVLLGWIIRHQVGAVVTLLALTLLVDPALQQLAPDVAKFLLTIAMSSVYRDAKPDLLPEPIAVVVIAGWLAAAWFGARKLFLARDIT
ncbi:ABC transporter permease subunit [Streptomyces coacervatus]|uniref:ABC transporter permease subunit n=1 Tax=Streptomyces coacervatus TaxID=647381 RepID=A0ABP7HRQ7_9ACTN|nr:ABC transporter permease [Streptomyces coacervatus]MDF2270734.1 ABC transporter permease [Streptomyces coacervatus]